MSFLRQNDNPPEKSNSEKKDNTVSETNYGMSPSCPDTKDAFKETDQNAWVVFSIKTMNEFREKLANFKDFFEAYNFLREKRQLASKELDHSKAGKGYSVSDYGRWRGYDYGFIETNEHVWPHKGNQAWTSQRDKVTELAYALIKKAESKDATTRTQELWNGKTITYKETPEITYTSNPNDEIAIWVKKEGQQDEEVEVRAVSHRIQLKSPQISGIEDYSHDLALITIYECEDKKNNRIDIRYAEPPSKNDFADFKVADQYYKNLLNWKKEDGVEEFLKRAGKLSHLIAPILPCKRGSAAIMEWMIRGIAAEKGIELGGFNHKEAISWDFRALLTSNRDEYAGWFAKSAFEIAKLAVPSLQAGSNLILKKRD